MELLAAIGLLTLLCLGVFVFLLFFSLGLLLVAARHNPTSKLLLQFVTFFTDSMYMPLKKFVSFLGGDNSLVDAVSIEARNILMKKAFAKVDFQDRVVILPQCLRSLNCPAELNPIYGLKCKGCGNCKIYEIEEGAKRLGYKGCYIIPGGGFIRRLICLTKPKAVVGIACPYEANWGLIEVSSHGIPSQGVVLCKTGCVQTEVELDRVFSTLRLRE